MELERSLYFSQLFISGPFSEPEEFCPHFHVLFEINFNIILPS